MTDLFAAGHIRPNHCKIKVSAQVPNPSLRVTTLAKTSATRQPSCGKGEVKKVDDRFVLVSLGQFR